VSGPLTYGEGRGFRQSNVFERAAALASRRLPAGPIRAWITRGFDVAMWIGTAGRGLRSTLPHGEVVRLTPACRRTFWNLEEYEAFRAATQPGDVVIEAGAHTGAYTVLFAQWVGATGHVFAFEPVPSIARELRAQLTLNRVADRVTVIGAAVAEGAGTLSLTRPALPGDPDAHRLAVPTVGLDEFCAERGARPRLVKVDVEGAELSVLRGARATFAAARPGHVFVEMHPSLRPACGLTAANVQQELHHQRLRAEPLRPKDDVWRVEGICARLSRLE
jgi:FkbM family methyltransferase